MISAVVPFYANPELHTHARFSLPLCLEPLLAHEKVKEVILVDDGSTINLEINASPKIRYYRIAHHGVGNARNVGIAKATQPYLLILDSDVIVSKQLIDAFVDNLNGGADIACVSYVETYINSIWDKCEELYWRYNESLPGKWWLSCGCMMTRREVFDAMRFESETLSDEDTVFSRKAKESNLKTVTLPLIAKHVFAATLQALRRKWFYGGKRVALSRTRTLAQTAKSTLLSPIFALKLAAKYRYPMLIPFITIRSLTFFEGFTSAFK